MLTESLQIQRDSDDKPYQAVLLNSIGAVYLTTGQYDNALTYFQQAPRKRLSKPSINLTTVASRWPIC